MSNNSGASKETKRDSTMFLYTALIFIAAIVIILLAFFSQTNLQNAQPANADVSSSPSAEENLQGIQKTASELSDKNMELLEENRSLNKRLDEAESENETYSKLIEAYGYTKAGNAKEAKRLIADIDYESLSADAKTLYDEINNGQ